MNIGDYNDPYIVNMNSVSANTGSNKSANTSGLGFSWWFWVVIFPTVVAILTVIGNNG